MALSINELTAITNDWFMTDDGAAWDIYFNHSYCLHEFLKKKRGLYEEVPGGVYFRVPIEIDEVVSNAYARGSSALTRNAVAAPGGTALKSYEQQIIDDALFGCAHYFSSAKVLRVDELKNGENEYSKVKHVLNRVQNAQKSLAKRLSYDFHLDVGAYDNRIFGTGECCYNGDLSRTVANDGGGTATYYGNIAYNLYSKGWVGKRNTDGGVIDLDTIRNGKNAVKIRDGKYGKPDMCALTPTLFATIQAQLHAQQVYIEQKDEVNSGFRVIVFEGTEIFEDDYVPSGTMVLLNSAYYGINVYENANMVASDWYVDTATPSDKFMDIYFDGASVTGMRDAHIWYTGLSGS